MTENNGIRFDWNEGISLPTNKRLQDERIEEWQDRAGEEPGEEGVVEVPSLPDAPVSEAKPRLGKTSGSSQPTLKGSLVSAIVEGLLGGVRDEIIALATPDILDVSDLESSIDDIESQLKDDIRGSGDYESEDGSISINGKKLRDPASLDDWLEDLEDRNQRNDLRFSINTNTFITTSAVYLSYQYNENTGYFIKSWGFGAATKEGKGKVTGNDPYYDWTQGQYRNNPESYGGSGLRYRAPNIASTVSSNDPAIRNQSNRFPVDSYSFSNLLPRDRENFLTLRDLRINLAFILNNSYKGNAYRTFINQTNYSRITVSEDNKRFSLSIGKGEVLRSKNFEIKSFKIADGVKTDQDPPKELTDVDNLCCQMIDEIHKSLNCKEILGPGLSTPSSLIAPGGNKYLVHRDYLSLVEFQIRMADHLSIHPFKVKLSDANPALKGNQPIEIEIRDATNFAAFITQMQLENDADSASRLNLQVRSALTLAQILTVVTKISRATSAIASYLGMPIREKIGTLKMAFDPFLGSRPRKGFDPKAAAKNIEINTEAATEEILPELLQSSEAPYIYEDFDGQAPTISEQINNKGGIY